MDGSIKIFAEGERVSNLPGEKKLFSSSVTMLYSIVTDMNTLRFVLQSIGTISIKQSHDRLVHSEPSDADNNVQPALLSTGELECPHPVAVDVPESTGGRVHPALASIGLCAVGGGSLINHSLLHDSAVHGKTVRGRCLGVWGSSGRDESFQNGVLEGELLIWLKFLNLWILLCGELDVLR